MAPCIHDTGWQPGGFTTYLNEHQSDPFNTIINRLHDVCRIGRTIGVASTTVTSRYIYAFDNPDGLNGVDLGAEWYALEFEISCLATHSQHVICMISSSVALGHRGDISFRVIVWSPDDASQIALKMSLSG